MLVDVGLLGADDGDLLLQAGVLDIEVGAPAAQGLAEGPGPVGGQHHKGDGLGADGADLGDAHLHLRQQLQQERLKLLVGLVDLVNEQHHGLLRADGFQQRPLQEILVAEEGAGQLLRVLAVHLHLDGEQLLLVVPLVQGLALVQALIALEPHQLPVQGLGHHLGNLRLAHAGGSLDEKGAAQLQCHQQGGHQTVVVDIVGGV